MRVEQGQGPAGAFGPFFGVEAYDDNGPVPGVLGTLGVDASNGDVLYQASGTGFLTATGQVVSFGQWNHFQIKLDYSTDQYTVFRNFAPLGTIGFVDPGLDHFSHADIAAIAAAGDPAASQAATGTAYFDNFVVREGACLIPEPSTTVLIGLGLIAVTCVTQRRQVGSCPLLQSRRSATYEP